MPEKIGADVVGRKKRSSIKNRKESARYLQTQIRKIAEDIKQNPRIIDEDTKKELRTLLINIEKSSRHTDPDFSQKAREWLSLIQKGVSLSADIVQLFTFLSGISSLPTLLQVIAVANRMAHGSTTISTQPLFRKKKPEIPKDVLRV
jgi:hypothetical protein